VQSEQIFARFNLLSCFNFSSNKNFKKVVKDDIIESQKNIYDLLKYPYVNQIIQRCKSDGSELDNYWKEGLNNSILSVSEDVICFISGKRNDFKNVISIFASIEIKRFSENSYQYYFQNNKQNELSIKIYIENINKNFHFFGIPSLVSNDN
jgi:hypothetical protein